MSDNELVDLPCRAGRNGNSSKALIPHFLHLPGAIGHFPDNCLCVGIKGFSVLIQRNPISAAIKQRNTQMILQAGIQRLTDDWATWSDAAAVVMFSDLATARKYSNCTISIPGTDLS